MNLEALAETLRASRGFAHKRDIAGAVARLARGSSQSVRNGDDCAAIPDGDGFLLFAIEGFVEDFVAQMPWFAGYCGVMVNVSDIAAMGGRAVAVVDALWSRDAATAEPVLQGLAAAAERYGVPVVGGHTNQRAASGQLAVSIVGRAKRLLTSFDARPGDTLIMAVDLRGEFMEPQPFWNASTSAPAERLRADLEILPALAESGLCDAAKDISMAGAVGTTLMLLEASGVGGTLDVAAVPRPEGVAIERWLQAFPSFGFVLSVRPENSTEVLARFAARGIAAACVGNVESGSRLWLRDGSDKALLWDHAEQPFIGAASVATSE
jgi:AIR synthase-related protein